MAPNSKQYTEAALGSYNLQFLKKVGIHEISYNYLKYQRIFIDFLNNVLILSPFFQGTVKAWIIANLHAIDIQTFSNIISLIFVFNYCSQINLKVELTS